MNDYDQSLMRRWPEPFIRHKKPKSIEYKPLPDDIIAEIIKAVQQVRTGVAMYNIPENTDKHFILGIWSRVQDAITDVLFSDDNIDRLTDPWLNTYFKYPYEVIPNSVGNIVWLQALTKHYATTEVLYYFRPRSRVKAEDKKKDEALNAN